MLHIAQKKLADDVRTGVALAREEARELARTGGEAWAGASSIDAANRARSSARYRAYGLGGGPYPAINFVADGPTMDCVSRVPGMGSRWRELTCAVRDWWQRSSIVASDAKRRWRQASC